MTAKTQLELPWRDSAGHRDDEEGFFFLTSAEIFISVETEESETIAMKINFSNQADNG